MRISAVIYEGWLGVTHTGSNVFKNPSRAELLKLIRMSDYQEVRAFLSKNLYVWNTDTLHHDFPMELLAPEDATCATRKGTKIRSCVNLHINANGPYIAAANVNFDDNGDPGEQFQHDKTLVENHPVMKRLFGTVTLNIEY